MVLKTFNVQEDIYSQFYRFCREHGMSMSKQIEMFMESVIEKEPAAKQAYLEKLDRIRSGRFIRVKSFTERYGLD